MQNQRTWVNVLGITMALATLSHAQVLVDYDDGQENGVHDKEIRGGGFTGMTDFKYSPWLLLSKTGGMKILTTTPCDVGSPENISVCEARVTAIDTGHTIAAGDKFNFSFHWRDGYGWGQDDAITLMLYYTDNDKADGATLGTPLVLTTGKITKAGTWEIAEAKNVSFVGEQAVGKRLFVRLLTRSGEKSWARADNIFVEVVPAETKAPAADSQPKAPEGDTKNEAKP